MWDDVNFAFRPDDPKLAYAQSKTADVLLAVEATRRWTDDTITSNALMLGAIYTHLQRNTGGRGSGRVPAHLIKTVEQGVANSVLLATSPLLKGIGGRCFAGCNETEVVNRRSGTLHGVAQYAVDPNGWSGVQRPHQGGFQLAPAHGHFVKIRRREAAPEGGLIWTHWVAMLDRFFGLVRLLAPFP